MLNDFLYIGGWWTLFFVSGVINFPITFFIFKKFLDGGYGFSKTIAFLIISYLAFVFSTIKIFPIRISVYVAASVLIFINLYFFAKHKKNLIFFFLKKIKIIAFEEFLFTSGFVFWSLVRAYQPDINGLEKFMDYGFINSILNSKFLPPTDMWFAGSTINYYWFGHFWASCITILSQIPQWISYNLLLASIMGLLLISTFSLVSNITFKVKPKINLKLILLSGLVSALLLTFAGNFHTAIYALKNGRENYWYPDATRFIGYNPETNDKTIHEFPIYSFVVSDLHAHVLNIPNVILYLGLLWIFFARKKPSLKNYLFCGSILGIMFMTSAWDFANYSLVTAMAITIITIAIKGISLENFLQAVKDVLLIIVAGLIITTPFLLSFKSIAQGIDIVKAHTPLWQLAILWGYPAILSLIFIFLIAHNYKRLKKADLFILSLITSAWALIALPEIIYFKDIYIASYHRANTMFKLTYQAFVLSYLTSGYIFIKSISYTHNILKKILTSCFFIAVFAAILWYPFFAIPSYYRNLKTYKGLSGESWLKSSHPYTYDAILWIRKTLKGQPVILEAPGNSYTEFNVISSYTGLPTVSGWFVHEWLWRGSSQFPQERVVDIDSIYTSQNIEQISRLLKKYNVSYVIIGEFENQKYKNINKEHFEAIGQEVYKNSGTSIYKVN